MDSKLTAGRVFRLIVAGATGILLVGPSEATALQRTTVCSAANFLAQPGAATVPTMVAYSILSFTNPNPGASGSAALKVIHRAGVKLIHGATV